MSEQAPNKAGNEVRSITEGLPDEGRELRNEVIERCAKAAEKAWPLAHTYASENADVYRGQDHAVRTVVKAIRALKQ